MTLYQARKILGLGPNDDPVLHLPEFKEAREHIAKLVRNAPNDAIADRYQKGLIEFDQALAAVHEYRHTGSGTPAMAAIAIDENVESASPLPVPVHASTVRLKESEVPKVPFAVPPPTQMTATDPSPPALDDTEPTPRSGRAISVFACLFILVVVGTGGAWLYQQRETSVKERNQIRVALLERLGSSHIENRRWPEASAAFAEIESITPGSQTATLGRRSIEAGMADEEKQFIGYWTGQTLAELEAGRLDQATSAARQVLAKFPDNQESKSLLEQIKVARIGQSKTAAITAARAQIDQRKFKDAIATANGILADSPNDPDAVAIISDANVSMKKALVDQTRAQNLLDRALARDKGQFDQQALDWLREAKSLDPENTAVATLFEKFSNYTRTLRVPGDFSTPQEALDHAHDRDRIILAPQTWKGPLMINSAVDLQSEDAEKTIIECAPQDGSAITIGSGADGAHISGITFRHESFSQGAERFSVALVRGGTAFFTDCHFMDASGHGLAVIEMGHATADHCQFSKNGWNGAAAIGVGATIEIKNSEALHNFEHGIETWDGAAAILTNNRCEGNSRNGIHVDNGLASATITGNQLINNREFGLVLDSAAAGNVTGNTARANLLGGLVVRVGAGKLSVTGNQATQNRGPGLVVEKGLHSSSYAANTLSQNSEPQLLADVNLSQHDDPAAGKKLNKEAPPTAIIVDPAANREYQRKHPR